MSSNRILRSTCDDRVGIVYRSLFLFVVIGFWHIQISSLRCVPKSEACCQQNIVAHRMFRVRSLLIPNIVKLGTRWSTSEPFYYNMRCFCCFEFQCCRVYWHLFPWLACCVLCSVFFSPSFLLLTGASSILLSSLCWLKTHIGYGLLLPQARRVNDLLHQLVKGLLHAQLGLCTALHK